MAPRAVVKHFQIVKDQRWVSAAHEPARAALPASVATGLEFIGQPHASAVAARFHKLGLQLIGQAGILLLARRGPTAVPVIITAARDAQQGWQPVSGAVRTSRRTANPAHLWSVRQKKKIRAPQGSDARFESTMDDKHRLVKVSAAGWPCRQSAAESSYRYRSEVTRPFTAHATGIASRRARKSPTPWTARPRWRRKSSISSRRWDPEEKTQQ